MKGEHVAEVLQIATDYLINKQDLPNNTQRKMHGSVISSPRRPGGCIAATLWSGKFFSSRTLM